MNDQSLQSKHKVWLVRALFQWESCVCNKRNKTRSYDFSVTANKSNSLCYPSFICEGKKEKIQSKPPTVPVMLWQLWHEHAGDWSCLIVVLMGSDDSYVFLVIGGHFSWGLTHPHLAQQRFHCSYHPHLMAPGLGEALLPSSSHAFTSRGLWQPLLLPSWCLLTSWKHSWPSQPHQSSFSYLWPHEGSHDFTAPQSSHAFTSRRPSWAHGPLILTCLWVINSCMSPWRAFHYVHITKWHWTTPLVLVLPSPCSVNGVC